MQYKTVTVEHYLRIPRKNCAVLGDKYQNIINECAADGWKLLGIHTLPIVEKAGCVKKIMGGADEAYNIDVLIFFKD